MAMNALESLEWHFWPLTSVCYAAIFPESDVDRTRRGHRENGARDPKWPLPGLSKACIGGIAVLASPAKIASPRVGATVQGGDQ
jgi:hypothetical protein